jgi:hypothetical protein
VELGEELELEVGLELQVELPVVEEGHNRRQFLYDTIFLEINEPNEDDTQFSNVIPKPLGHTSHPTK